MLLGRFCRIAMLKRRFEGGMFVTLLRTARFELRCGTREYCVRRKISLRISCYGIVVYRVGVIVVQPLCLSPEVVVPASRKV